MTGLALKTVSMLKKIKINRAVELGTGITWNVSVLPVKNTEN